MSRLSSRDRGASAVEFALVVPLLIVLAFGIIDFGLYFADSLSTRQGVREGARQGVVNACGSTSCIADLTKDEISPVAGGAEYVKVVVEDGTWERGKDLTVCAVVEVNGVTGFTPLPDDRVFARTSMRIEQADPPTAGPYPYEDALPGGWGTTCS